MILPRSDVWRQAPVRLGIEQLPRRTFIVVDITTPPTIPESLSKPDFVYHY